MEEQRQKRRRRLVLVPLPFQGHINPMLQLGSVLHSKGFSITVVHTAFNSPHPSNHPQLHFVSIPDQLSDQIISSGNLVLLLSVLNENCRLPLEECLVRMAEQQKEQEDIACVIFDEYMYASEAAAKNVKIQSIILRTIGASTFIPRNAIAQLTAQGLLSFQGSTSEDLVPGLHPLRYKDLPVSKSGISKNFLQLMSIVYDTRTSSAVIWNTADVLEQSSLARIQKQCKVPMFPIGPLHKVASASSSSLLKEDISCIKWLEKQIQNSVLYISLGSVASIDNKELVEMAWGLANSKQPFLWVIRPDSVQDMGWNDWPPEGFTDAVGERGCIVKWAPQKEVLAHPAVGGFWTHCGWNSTLESISEGVPIICRPCFGDQRVNARFVSHVWRIGLQLEYLLDRGEIEKAVTRLMADNEGEEMRNRARNLKEMVQLCIREGGSSYNSLNQLVELVLSF